MQILVVHCSDGVYDAFTGTLAEINDSLRKSKYWGEIVKRLDHLSEEEITVEVIDNRLHHDGDSEYGFTLIEPISPTAPLMTHEEKVKYFTDALNICGFGVTESMIDFMVRVYDLILENKGDTNLRQLTDVRYEHKKAFPDPKSEESESTMTKKETVEDPSTP